MRTIGVAVLAAASLVAGCAGARLQPNHREMVDRLVQPVLDGGWTSSMVVGLTGPGGTEIHGYGRTESGARPDGRTLYEIGSVTKTFTGLLLSWAVDAGEVSLQQPVQELLPPGTAVAHGRDGKPITLEHLATHTSGLPREPDDLSGPDDPFAGYDAERLYRFLGRATLLSEPGERFRYSNVGAGLLGHALSLRAGRDYGDLVRERILEPLGMRDTTVTLSPGQARRFAQPHDGDLRPISAWGFAALAGTGGLRSTARDLLRWVAAQSGLTPTALAPAMGRTHAPRFQIDPQTTIGLAWMREGRFVCHQGGTRGSESFVCFDLETRAGVVVLVDASTGYEVAKKVGVALVRTMAGGQPGALDLPPSVKLPSSALDVFAGTYELTDPASGRRLTMTIAHTGDALEATLPDGRRHRLYAASETEFYLRSGDRLRGTFERGPAGGFDSILVHQPGAPELTATRVR